MNIGITIYESCNDYIKPILSSNLKSLLNIKIVVLYFFIDDYIILYNV